MPFSGPQNISLVRIGVKLGVTSNDIPKLDFKDIFKTFHEKIHNTDCPY
jgi:hypothetical protein